MLEHNDILKVSFTPQNVDHCYNNVAREYSWAENVFQ
jgi:hypothetical protein